MAAWRRSVSKGGKSVSKGRKLAKHGLAKHTGHKARRSRKLLNSTKVSTGTKDRSLKSKSRNLSRSKKARVAKKGLAKKGRSLALTHVKKSHLKGKALKTKSRGHKHKTLKRAHSHKRPGLGSLCGNCFPPLPPLPRVLCMFLALPGSRSGWPSADGSCAEATRSGLGVRSSGAVESFWLGSQLAKASTASYSRYAQPRRRRRRGRRGRGRG